MVISWEPKILVGSDYARGQRLWYRHGRRKEPLESDHNLSAGEALRRSTQLSRPLSNTQPLSKMTSSGKEEVKKNTQPLSKMTSSGKEEAKKNTQPLSKMTSSGKEEVKKPSGKMPAAYTKLQQKPKAATHLPKKAATQLPKKAATQLPKKVANQLPKKAATSSKFKEQLEKAMEPKNHEKGKGKPGRNCALFSKKLFANLQQQDATGLQHETAGIFQKSSSINPLNQPFCYFTEIL